MGELGDLRAEIERLSAAVKALTETQATQTDLLRMIVETAAEEGGSDSLYEAVEKVATVLDRQTQTLDRIEAAVLSGRRPAR